jgi:Mrp family chromosome partitioning ATPase
MSALDQAIIKAYAKDRPPAAPVTAVRMSERPLPVVQQPRSPAIEQLYHEGSLYRVEHRTEQQRGNRILPAPHLPMLPPTSPRRNIRRSMLKLMANSQSASPIEPSVEPPPRVARKVIFRHISHPATPPPRGLLRTSSLPVEANSELPPQITPHEAESPPPAAPATPAPQNAPLNIEYHEESLLEVRGTWSEGQAVSPMILVSEPTESGISSVTVHLDALSAAEQAGWAWADVNTDPITTQEPPPFFAGKLLDRDEPAIAIRLDAPHAFGRHRPHAHFPVPEPEKAEQPVQIADLPEAPSHVERDNDQNHVSEEVQAEAVLEPAERPSPGVLTAQAPLTEQQDLTFAEPVEVPLDTLLGDLVPIVANTETAAHSQNEAVAESAPSKPTVPLWEVDRFHWPRTCEKLFADQNGYLARAGDKLLAAVQDGLRVLAVTGSRRGEGRSTLALCLARAAARAGVQAAVMDADFARPQLASKIGLEIAFGWQDAAVGRIPLSEAAVKSLADNVTMLPLESSAASKTLSLADPRVTATIRAAAATFELLILDLGPLGAGKRLTFPPGETCPLDAAIVVRDLRFATVSESETVGRMLQDAGVEAVGVAENFVIEEEIPATSV